LKAAGATDEQIKQAIEARREVENVISWTVKDVNRILSAGGGRLVDDSVRSAIRNSQTLSQFVSALTKKPSEVAPSSAPRGESAPESPLAQRMDQAGATPGVSVADIREKAQKAIADIVNRTDIDSFQKIELSRKIGDLYKQKTGMDLNAR
jgi:hypothetical protein